MAEVAKAVAEQVAWVASTRSRPVPAPLSSGPDRRYRIITADPARRRLDANPAYFGEGAYGIYAASQVYFHKPPDELTIEEAALLAGLVREPSGFAPGSEDPDQQRRAPGCSQHIRTRSSSVSMRAYRCWRLPAAHWTRRGYG